MISHSLEVLGAHFKVYSGWKIARFFIYLMGMRCTKADPKTSMLSKKVWYLCQKMRLDSHIIFTSLHFRLVPLHFGRLRSTRNR